MESVKKMYMTAEEVANALGVSKGYAYKIIKSLNAELTEKGYKVVSGRIPTQFFEEKFYGFKMVV